MLLYLPTYSPWLNPIEMRQKPQAGGSSAGRSRSCEPFANIQALLTATRDFCDRCNRMPDGVRSILGAHPA